MLLVNYLHPRGCIKSQLTIIYFFKSYLNVIHFSQDVSNNHFQEFSPPKFYVNSMFLVSNCLAHPNVQKLSLPPCFQILSIRRVFLRVRDYVSQMYKTSTKNIFFQNHNFDLVFRKDNKGLLLPSKGSGPLGPFRDS
jgi:hypothetical protein